MSGAKKKSAYEFSAVPGGRAPKIFRLGTTPNGPKKAPAAPDETAKEKKAPVALPEAPPAAPSKEQRGPSKATKAPAAAPNRLAMLGNHEVWQKIATHFQTEVAPVVLSGPVGVGKSVGLLELAARSGMRAIVTDAAENDEALLATVRDSLASTNSQGRRILLVIDDFESFTIHMRPKLFKLVQKLCTGSCKTACVFVCNEARDPAVSPWLKQLVTFKLRRPHYSELRVFFSASCPWVSHDGVSRVGFSPAAISSCGAFLASGDIRRARMALEWRARMGTRPVSDQDLFLNPFELSRRLLLNKIPFALWAENAEPFHVELMQHHLPVHSGDCITRLAEGLDDMGALGGGGPHATHVAALAAKLTSRAEGVQALVPPRPPYQRPRAEAADRALSSLSSRSAAIEVPALLRERLS